MSWQQIEFLLKGIYVGLLVFVALLHPGWHEVAQVFAYTLGGLAVCLGVAGYYKVRAGYRVRGRWPAFVLFLLLEHTALVYAGVLLGMAVGAYAIAIADPSRLEVDGVTTLTLLACTVGGGALLGVLLYLLRLTRVRVRRVRLGLHVVLALILGAAAYFLLRDLSIEQKPIVGALFLFGAFFFYLLTFVGMVEETTVEFAVLCAAVGVGLWLILVAVSEPFVSLAVGVPIALFILYVRYILPGLRVFKHVLRGIGYAGVGANRLALWSLGRAIQLDPANSLARETLWRVHRGLNFDEIVKDPEALTLVNFDLCLERVGELLANPPTPAQKQEAERMLGLVSAQRPPMEPRCTYWRAVLLLHEKQTDEAVEELSRLLDLEVNDVHNPHRQAILLQAWQLALFYGPEAVKRRVGAVQLALPGRRMEAIAAIERRLTQEPNDAGAWDLKRYLYSDLSEPEYQESVPIGQAAAEFDHEYVLQLGQANLKDPVNWQRGVELLRIAARGLPRLASSIFIQIAQAYDRAGDPDLSWTYYRKTRDAGRAVGASNLANEDRHTYFAVVKMLAEDARTTGDDAAAIENYHLYTEYERSGKETYRQLAELHQRQKDAWAALRCVEQGLKIYDATDKDFLTRKDSYYYSVTPEELQQRLEEVTKYFDVDYCLKKAKWLLEQPAADHGLLEWAEHLVKLAQVARPDSIGVKVLMGRILRRRGQVQEAMEVFKAVRENKPEGFSSSDDEEAWYLSCRLLGEMYLEERPDLAVPCLIDFRKSSKSGADTDYKLGVAYEHLGDRARAQKCYQMVASYQNHPRAPDAREALYRLQTEQQTRE
jgi:tetratricopeptide (TPR) repeat protein